MNGPQNQGLLARLRANMRNQLDRLRANDTLRRLSRGRPDIMIFGAPVVAVAAIAAIVVVVVVFAGGGSDDGRTARGTATAATTAAATPTPGANAGLKTPIPISPGSALTDQDLAARGAGEAGRGDFTGQRLVIPKIGVDAEFTVRVVPGSGQMPNPNGPWDVAWYDFSGWPGLGGVPNQGGNIVLAGHVDYINVGPAVFWDLHTLAAGDRVQIVLNDGSIAEYEVVFNKAIGADVAPWEAIVAGTAQESLTLITCGGEFSAGHYNNRQIIWAQRV
ncbi:MAG: class F sortase [Dehalococcoidia bacterium]